MSAFEYHKNYKYKDVHCTIRVDEHQRDSELLLIDDNSVVVLLPYGMLVDLGYHAVRHYRDKHRKRVTCGKGVPHGCGKQFYVYWNGHGYSNCPDCGKPITHKDHWFEIKKPWREV